jgi:hypothetical protein
VKSRQRLAEGTKKPATRSKRREKVERETEPAFAALERVLQIMIFCRRGEGEVRSESSVSGLMEALLHEGSLWISVETIARHFSRAENTNLLVDREEGPIDVPAWSALEAQSHAER